MRWSFNVDRSSIGESMLKRTDLESVNDQDNELKTARDGKCNRHHCRGYDEIYPGYVYVKGLPPSPADRAVV